MSKVDDLIAAARAELGSKYVYGDEGPDTFDCSGLMQWIYAGIGIKLPRSAAQQQAYTTAVANPVPGDLVFFGHPAHHVGLYIGDGKMIAAPHTGDVVKIQNVYQEDTSYGRVPGIGAAATSALNTVSLGLTSTLTSMSDDIRNMLIKMLFVGGGLALFGIGIVRTLSRKKER